MHPLTTTSYIFKRLADDWKLLLSALMGIIVATSLIAGAPVYVRALERQSLDTAIERSSRLFLNLFVASPYVPLNAGSLEDTERLLDDSLQRHMPEIQRGRERYLKTQTLVVGLPTRPLPGADSPESQVSRGYFQYLSNLERHVRFLDGEMGSGVVTPGPQGPIIEAVLGSENAEVFKLKKGDLVTLTPSLGNPTRISVVITGILEPTDVSEEYWGYSPSIFVEPAPLDEVVDPEVRADPNEPPLALFVTQEAMAEGVGRAYPGTLVNSSWFIYVDKEPLKEWSVLESRTRLKDLQNALSTAMPGSTLITGIGGLVDDFEHRSFFSSVPLLLLLTIMVITVLYYLSMMVSYLVQSRENDVALLRSRGISTLQLLRLYALEGLVLTVVAVVLAPFLAMGAVAAAGMLPYFREITGGDMLPVDLHWMPFVAAAGAGLLSLAIFVIPAVVGARTGLIIHKLRSSRPPSVPFFHRYYLDVGLLVVGGLIFWELHDRGQFVSGGLFKDVQVNEALLLAPVLFLTVVALVFLRFFPLFVRFISGESPALLHLVMAATLVTLAPAIVAREVDDGDGLAWLGPVVTLAALAVAYWLTQRAQGSRGRLVGLALQAGLVFAVVAMEPPVAGEFSFVPTMSLIAIVPAQVVFLLLTVLARVSPVWVSMGLWHMARNPLQYSWLVLLLVMVTGLGVLATTVGGTLDRSHEERVFYDVGADIRVTGVRTNSIAAKRDLKETYLKIPGVTAVSLAFRGEGIVGATTRGNRFEVLALESQDFPYVSWYRDDFSALPLTGVMRALQPSAQPEPVLIPDGATSIGVWAKPEGSYPSVFLWAVVEDANGFVTPMTLGELGDPEWHLMRTDEIHPILKRPLRLVAMQLFEPGFGATGTPGKVLLDNIHVTIGPGGREQGLEDFENGVDWSVVPTSVLTSDAFATTAVDAYQGDRAAVFTFGKETNGGIRGFFRSPSGGPLPIVASSSFLTAAGANVGDPLILSVDSRLITVVIRDTVEYFPTMSPRDRGYIVADLEGLLKHLNIVNPIFSRITPNELFISEAPGAGEAVYDVVLQLVRLPHRVHDKDSQLASFRLDPLVTAGWKAMVVLSLGIIVFAAGFGYVTYMLSYADRSRSEMGFLQAMGLSRRQMMGLLGLEQLVIVTVGLALGTWAGFQMSTLMVSSVAVTETGQEVVPPFILTTDWAFMAPIFVALAAIFLAALYRLNRGMLRLDLHNISRVEG